MDDLEFLATKDIKEAAQKLTADEARYLVDLYYQIQDFRKATGNQLLAVSKTGEPSSLINGTFTSMQRVENRIKKGLDYYSDSIALGQWAKSVVGIGPVIASGLLAHIDINKATSAAHIWRFAGLDPTLEWKAGQKRPFNARLKTLCWKIGESFVKVSGNPESLYGRLYLQRKALEQQRNERLELADQAQDKLKKFKIGKNTDAYKSYSIGKLPPAHIHARAKRWAVKVFLCHYFEEGCRLEGREPPTIYSIAMLGHVDKIEAEGRQS